jgi:anti-sigma factor RsiW
VPSVRCDEAALLEYLDGALDPLSIEQLEAHLLRCDACWWSVRTDRSGRDLARAAREITPATLADRIERAVSQARERPTGRRRRRTLAAAGALAIAAAGVIWQTSSAPPHHSDPRLIAAVVEVSSSEGEVPDTLTVGADAVELARVDLGGTEVTIARGDQPFPMPAEADPVPGHPGAWATQRGSLTIVCVTSPAPMLVVGDADLDALVAAISS